MHIEELAMGEMGLGGSENPSAAPNEGLDGSIAAASDVKKVLIGAGARVLFYPTLLYNVMRNKIQAEFRWWDKVDRFVLLGAVPFPTDVPRLKDLGVRGVITLNEPYETLVPSSLYHAHGIGHLVIPTRDYLFAPSMSDICQAVGFIQKNALCGHTTYVHCKAGRGRSTTIVLCYLVKHKHMTPDAAFSYVRSIRPRVLLASSQWQALQKYYHLEVKGANFHSHVTGLCIKMPISWPAEDVKAFSGSALVAKNLVAFDDGSVVVVSKADLDGYDQKNEMCGMGSEIWTNLSIVYRVRGAGEAALARISCLWLRCGAQQMSGKKLSAGGSCSIRADQLGDLSVDIRVY